MTHFHQQPLVIDYRLRMPWYIPYAIVAGIGVVALGVAYQVSMPTNQMIATIIIGVGLVILVPALALWGFVQILQTARNRLRDMMVEPMNWRGDETVLDVGTGSGILLFACAKYLRTGRATGIDIYDPNAGGGSPEIFWRNAQAEGVAERVELLNVDARQMTFADETFDVTVSSLAMHHVGAAQDRRRATEEIIRVLKSGGKVVICDMTAVIGDCEQALRHGRMTNILRRDYMGLFSILSAEKI
jgi:SAM-dependent methyltransferase